MRLGDECFTTNPKTGAFYSKCETCRPKHSVSCHTKRNSDIKAQKRALERGNTPETLICTGCGPKPISAFGINGLNGKPHANCKMCHSSMLYQKIEYKQTEGGKSAEKRYRQGKTGQATAERFVQHRTVRRRLSSALRMDNAIMCASNRLISGQFRKSPTFVARTGFHSEAAFLGVVASTFAPGMTMSNNGTVWELDHKIPREAYDFDNPEDVRRCWSPKNVHALTKEANMEKAWKLVDQYITEAGIENFPVAWGGKFPDGELKIEHSVKALVRKTLAEEKIAEAAAEREAADAEEEEEECSSSDDESSDDESSDESACASDSGSG